MNLFFQVPNTSGKKALAMEAFARALRQLPTIIADNGGYDGSDLISSLRAAHAQGAKVRVELGGVVRGPVIGLPVPAYATLLSWHRLALCDTEVGVSCVLCYAAYGI